MNPSLSSLVALALLLPAAVAFPSGRAAGRGTAFWGLLALAGVGLVPRLAGFWNGPWPTGLSASLWVSIAAALALFAGTAWRSDSARRLGALLLPYLALLALLAIAWDHAPERPMRGTPSDWLPLHIVASILTYGLITLAAIAALGAALQERALKSKHPTAFSHGLPALAACERLTVRFLAAGEGVLALGVASGMAVHYMERGTLLGLDHKTVLTLGAFVVIGAILVSHVRWGLRGKAAARLVMAAYLLITLGYPGVKFVTDVLLAGTTIR